MTRRAVTSLLLSASLAWFSAGRAIPVTSVTLSSGGSVPSSYSYVNSGSTVTMNFGLNNDKTVNGFGAAGGLSFVKFSPISGVKLQRVNNANATGRLNILYYEINAAGTATSHSYRPNYLATTEEALASGRLGVGADNVFVNAGNSSGNNNNIERIDFFITPTTVPRSRLKDLGFVIFERGGNDNFKIAAITGVDASGNATSFGPLISRTTSDWGTTNVNVTTDVVRNTPVLTDPVEAAKLRWVQSLTSQNAAGQYVTLSDLGVNGGDTVYGYVLMAADAPSTDVATALTGTVETGNGLDPISGIGLFIQDQDFGDAPDTYGTLLNSDGPRHGTGTVKLGPGTTTIDTDGFAGRPAGSRSSNASDDSGDDGVTVGTAAGPSLQGSTLTRGVASTLQVQAPAGGVLNAWIDWNRNGIFDTAEQVATNLTPTGGVITLTVTPPSGTAGATFARFRISSASGLGPTGNAPDGEVEDYGLTLTGSVGVSGVVYADANVSGDLTSGEAGVSGVTVTALNTAGTAVGSAVTDAAGTYAFPVLVPGTYTIQVTTPAGNLNTSSVSQSVTVGAASVSNVNFGLFNGTRVQGTVFRDAGAAGGAPANDAVQGAGEAGLAQLTVTARTGAGLLTSAVTSGNGTYELYLPAAAGAVTVSVSPQQGAQSFTATGTNDGVTATLATGPRDAGASAVVIDAAARSGTAVTRNFGLIPPLRFASDGQQTALSPGVATYLHRVVPGTPGTLTFSVTPPAASRLTYLLWQDVNSNGRVDPGTDVQVLGGQGSGAVTVPNAAARQPDGTLTELNFILEALVPAGLSAGATDAASLIVRQTPLTNAALLRSAFVTDTTVVSQPSSGALRLTKFVRNVTLNRPFSLSGSDGATGEQLEYCINYANSGPQPLLGVTLTDTAPFFTSPALNGYAAGMGIRHVPGAAVQAGGSVTPGNAAHNLTNAAGDDDGTLSPVVGAANQTKLTVNLRDLPGQASGTVCYRVTVQ